MPNYKWTAIDDILAPKPEENVSCVVCVENTTPDGSEWHLIIAHWYEEGAGIDIFERDGTKHHFSIKSDGFYYIEEAGPCKLFKVHGAKFWTTLELPKVKPDDILTIE